MANPLKMMSQMMRVQKQMKKIKASGSCKDGSVRISMNGVMKVTDVEIDESMLEPGAKRQLESKIAEAFKEAKKKVEKKMRDQMSLGDLQGMSGMMDRMK